MKDKFKLQQHYYKRRMNNNGVESTVFVILKPLHSWEDGISFEELVKRVRELRKKEISDSRIRHAISMHNRFGVIYGIYIKSDFGWIGEKKNNQKEWRYFVPKDSEAINREHQKLTNLRDVGDLKEENLTNYEIKTIPQEKNLESLRDQQIN